MRNFGYRIWSNESGGSCERGKSRSQVIENLFAPLDITDFEWEKDAAGYHRGSSGLIMRAPDLAKIGQLYLQKGQWEGHQIVSQPCIEQSVAKQVQVNETVVSLLIECRTAINRETKIRRR